MRQLVEVQVQSEAIKQMTNGNPLILKDAITFPAGDIEEGSLLRLVDKSGGYIGTGYYGAQNKGIGWIFQRDFSYLIPRKNDKVTRKAKREAKRVAREARKAAKRIE